MEKLQPRTEVVGIDEAQFLGDEVVEVCTKLANLGKRVIVAGLDTDYKGRPFEPMRPIGAASSAPDSVPQPCRERFAKIIQPEIPLTPRSKIPNKNR